MSEHAKPSVSQKGNVDTNKIDQIAFSKGVNLDEQTSSLRVNTKNIWNKDFFSLFLPFAHSPSLSLNLSQHELR